MPSYYTVQLGAQFDQVMLLDMFSVHGLSYFFEIDFPRWMFLLSWTSAD